MTASAELGAIPALALRDFTHPLTGETIYRRSVTALDRATYEQLRQLGDVIFTYTEGLRHMTKIKALAITAEPSTGNTLLKGQVAVVSDEDAQALIAAGEARAANDDEKVTRDVGKLRTAQLPSPESEEDE